MNYEQKLARARELLGHKHCLARGSSYSPNPTPFLDRREDWPEAVEHWNQLRSKTHEGHVHP